MWTLVLSVVKVNDHQCVDVDATDHQCVDADAVGRHHGIGAADRHQGTGVLTLHPSVGVVGRKPAGASELHCGERVEMNCHLLDGVVVRHRVDHQETLGNRRCTSRGEGTQLSVVGRRRCCRVSRGGMVPGMVVVLHHSLAVTMHRNHPVVGGIADPSSRLLALISNSM